MKKLWFIGVLMLLLLATPVIMAQDATEEMTPKAGGTLRAAWDAEWVSLDPHLSSAYSSFAVLANVVEGLTTFDNDIKLTPDLAESWEQSADGLTWTFKIRQGVKFSNGQDMTSADVLASFERFAKVSTNASLLADVEKYETPDPLTFIVHLKSTNAVFVDLLKSSTYPVAILPASQKDKPARDIEITGTGPFKLGEWQKDSHLILLRNDA